jgi:hypothetical protein
LSFYWIARSKEQLKEANGVASDAVKRAAEKSLSGETIKRRVEVETQGGTTTDGKAWLGHNVFNYNGGPDLSLQNDYGVISETVAVISPPTEAYSPLISIFAGNIVSLPPMRLESNHE